MIEAVNSVVANAALLRGNADQGQQDRLNTIASNPQTERVELALAPYVSPFIQVDTNFNKAVLQIRDSDTGDVVNQFPSETTMRARAAQAEIQNQQALSGALGRGTPASSDNRGAAAPSGVIGAGDVSAAKVAEAQIASSVLGAGAMSMNPQQAVSLSVFA